MNNINGSGHEDGKFGDWLTEQQDSTSNIPMQLRMMDESSTTEDIGEEDFESYLNDIVTPSTFQSFNPAFLEEDTLEDEETSEQFTDMRAMDDGSEDGSIDFMMDQDVNEKMQGVITDGEDEDMFVDGSSGMMSPQGSFGLSLLQVPMSMNTLNLGNSVTSLIPAPTDEHQKTIRFAQVIAAPIGKTTEAELNMTTHSDASIDTLDIFKEGMEGQHTARESSNGSLESSFNDEDDDDSEMSAHDEDEEEKKIRRQLMYAVGGAGMMALAGWAGKQILKLFDKVRSSRRNNFITASGKHAVSHYFI
jgi:hypothetical protein